MKRMFIGLLALFMAFNLTGCKSKEERELEKAREELRKSQEAADKAWADYYELQSDIERYKELQDLLK